MIKDVWRRGSERTVYSVVVRQTGLLDDTLHRAQSLADEFGEGGDRQREGEIDVPLDRFPLPFQLSTPSSLSPSLLLLVRLEVSFDWRSSTDLRRGTRRRLL